MTVAAEQEIELTIDSIATGGEGVGRTDGMVVFVPRTAPGDRVRVEVDRRKRFGRGTLVSVVAPGNGRVEPRCPHYLVDGCGGCQLQHIDYRRQLDAKAQIIRDGVTRIGKRRVEESPRVEPSVLEWRYRSKLTLAMRKQRGGWTIGLHRFDDPDAVFQLEDCLITDARVVGIWKSMMQAAHLLPDVKELRGSVQLIVGSEALAAVIDGGAEWPERDEFFRAVPWLQALWWKPAGAPRTLVAERGSPASAVSFRQVNEDVAQRLTTHVLGRVNAYQPSTAVDAYSGTGAIAVSLAANGVRVTAIEADRDAASDCARRLGPGSQSLAGRVEDLLEPSLPADVVVLNPPRGGLHPRVTSVLEAVESPPRGILYVSCDPATLGRDLAKMPRYRVESLRGFDMFPQTAHVETVCELVPIGPTGNGAAT